MAHFSDVLTFERLPYHTIPYHPHPTQAKTIDLCNNPLHKESKLNMARRVISGPLFERSWTELDNEVREVELEAA
jgi:hypothetical protein